MMRNVEKLRFDEVLKSHHVQKYMIYWNLSAFQLFALKYRQQCEQIYDMTQRNWRVKKFKYLN